MNFRKWLALFALLPTLLFGGPHYLTICALFHNEAQWLEEWIEYHLLVGVDHFVLYDFNSTDNWREVLQPYVEEGVVDIVQPIIPRLQKPQSSVYRECTRRFLDRSVWIAYIDINEFLCPVSADNIKDILPEFEKYGGVVVNWRCFGTSGVEKLTADELMIEKLTWAAPRDGFYSRGHKTIAQPRRLKSGWGYHNFEYLPPYHAVNTDGKKVRSTSWWRIPSLCDNKIVINHYYTRTKEWMLGERLDRLVRAVREPLNYHRQALLEADRLCSVEEDLRIQRFVPRLKRRLRRQ